MGPVTRRQSMRLLQKADANADAENKDQSERPLPPPPLEHNSIGSTIASADGNRGRVTKPAVERRGRVIASRYMSSSGGSRRSSSNIKVAEVANGGYRKEREDSRPLLARPSNASQRMGSGGSSTMEGGLRKELALLAAKRRVSAMVSVSDTPRKTVVRRDEDDSRSSNNTVLLAAATPADSASRRLYSTYLQWQLIEARSQMVFDAAKDAAADELGRLAGEAQAARRDLADTQRKHKLMTELDALTRWLAANRRDLTEIGAQVSRVRQHYTVFGGNLAQTTRAMPIRNVHYGDGESFVREMHAFVRSVGNNASDNSDGNGNSNNNGPDARVAMDAAAKLSRLYRAQRQETELVSECARMRESLAHTAALAIGRSIDEWQRQQ
ncbi:hypothetical protein H4S06_005804 [Coemansia sp. BCRC 34490]|nr:hypothetical protein H4S06_005804 [Coemansia sp. BCRC 34490]